MFDAHSIFHAVETYGESAASDMVTMFGGGDEAGALIVIEGGLRLQRIIRFETSDGRTFKPKG